MLKLSGKECRECKLGKCWDDKHKDHFVSRYRHTIYKGSEEIIYDCYLCLMCEEVARIEIGRRNAKISERKPPRRETCLRHPSAYENFDEKALFGFNKSRKRRTGDEVYGDMSSESGSTEWEG